MWSITTQAQVFDSEMNTQHRLAMRMIGHTVLQAVGDSSSRVLPIQKVQGRYKIGFVEDFAFYPEDVRAAIDNTLQKTGLERGYLVEIESCETHSIVYSYSVGHHPVSDLVSCSGRLYPEGCYALFISLWSNSTSDDQQISDLDDIQASERGIKQWLLPTICFLIVLCLIGLFFWNKRKPKPSIETQVIQLGQFRFDQKNMMLLHGDIKTELSAKEADLLFLLYKSENQTLERDSILKVVWGNQGDYVGRTLDVFISKLRKKLAADDNLKIINIRGVGYKFVMNER
jgi:DNA-binding winged helix-turn-helix (wHTH) protein